MARDLEPKCKYCRRAGTKLFLKGERCNTPKCAIVKRNYPPGVHGPNQTRRRLTGFGTQLLEKQKLKRVYGILEKQLRIYFDKSIKKTGDTADYLFQALELRLDNVVFRMGYAESRAKARQLINHGHFYVNGTKATIPSMQLRINDEVSIKDSHKDLKVFANISDTLKKNKVADWLYVDAKKASGKVLALPVKDAIKEFDLKMVIEFYSK